MEDQMNNAIETVAEETQDVDEVRPQYFSVSTPKFILMAICTFGVYELYWFYKNWAHVKQLENTNIWPFWRAVFARLNAYFLFKRVRQQVKDLGISKTLPAGPLSILYFLLAGTMRLPDPYWLVALMTFAPLLVVNEAMIEINKKSVANFQQNNRIQGWNWLAVVLGGLLVVGAVIGNFLPAEV
jgi:hypothetical protein